MSGNRPEVAWSETAGLLIRWPGDCSWVLGDHERDSAVPTDLPTDAVLLMGSDGIKPKR
jgi:hypothetical protein